MLTVACLCHDLQVRGLPIPNCDCTAGGESFVAGDTGGTSDAVWLTHVGLVVVGHVPRRSDGDHDASL